MSCRHQYLVMFRLQHLNIASCGNLNVDEICLVLSNYNKSLVSLDLWRNTSLTSSGVYLLAKGLPLLEELDLGWCLGVNAQTGCILALAKGCKKLVKVRILLFSLIKSSLELGLLDLSCWSHSGC